MKDRLKTEICQVYTNYFHKSFPIKIHKHIFQGGIYLGNQTDADSEKGNHFTKGLFLWFPQRYLLKQHIGGQHCISFLSRNVPVP